MRRLVISMISTVGNYEYGFFWYLYLDGSLEFEAKLTGVISTGAVPPGTSPAHGVLVAPGLYGPHHQHFFNVRLDVELDGGPNTVVEVDSVPDPVGPDNPTGVAWPPTGSHHVVRPEDWPVMPVSRIGFELRPDGFFDGNPALDLPWAPAPHAGGGTDGAARGGGCAC